jgi:hypothetical protein
VGGVDVGDEVNLQVRLSVGSEGLGDHQRAEIGAADADIDDVGDGLAGVPFPGAAAHPAGEVFHLGENGVDLGHHVLAGDADRPIRAVAQRYVQHRASFGDVDRLAGEHCLDALGETGLAGEGKEKRQRLVDDAVLGKIEEDVLQRQGKLLAAFRIGGEEVAHLPTGDLALMRGESLPGR